MKHLEVTLVSILKGTLPGWKETMEKYHQEALWVTVFQSYSLYFIRSHYLVNEHIALDLQDCLIRCISHFPSFCFLSLACISEVTKAVSRLIALALDLDVDFFDRPEFLGRPIATLRLLHYEGKYGEISPEPSCFSIWSELIFWFHVKLGKLSDPSNGIFGAGAHSDYGLITLLATDDVSGLQVNH